MTKFLLIVWIGIGSNGQTISLNSFDSSAECEAVRQVAEIEIDYEGIFKCVPYSYDVVEK